MSDKNKNESRHPIGLTTILPTVLQDIFWVSKDTIEYRCKTSCNTVDKTIDHQTN